MPAWSAQQASNTVYALALLRAREEGFCAAAGWRLQRGLNPQNAANTASHGFF